MSDATYRFSTASDRPFATHLLHRPEAGQLLAAGIHGCHAHGRIQEVELRFKRRRRLALLIRVGRGAPPRFMYEGCLLETTVSIHSSETVKDIIKLHEYSATHVAKQISIAGIRDADQMKRLLSDASKHAASILRQDQQPGA